MMLRLVVLCSYLFGIFASRVETQLRKDLLQDYDFQSRPVENHSTIVHIYYETAIYQLVGFSSEAQTIKMLTFQRMEWIDEFLRWDPANYSGIESMRLYRPNLWTPDVVPFNDVGNTKYDRFNYVVPILVRHTGLVHWAQPANYETSCSMDTTRFPFDSQTCHISIGSWQYSTSEIRMSCDHVDLSVYSSDSLWELQSKSLIINSKIHSKNVHIFSLEKLRVFT